MILYIADNDSIQKYHLSDNTDENFLFKYIPRTKEGQFFFNVFFQNNKWYLRNDSNFRAVTSDNAEISVLENDISYKLNIAGCTSNPILYCGNTINKNIWPLYLIDTTSIMIGKTDECQIYGPQAFDFSGSVKIIKEGTRWYLNISDDPNCRVYLNNKRVSRAILKRGDVIFVNGVRVAWMQEFIKVMDSSKIKVRRLKALKPPVVDNNVKLDDEGYIPLYQPNEYFYHKPNLKNIVSAQSITIDPPPRKEMREEMPMWIMLGSRITMVVFALVMCLSAYNTYLNTQDFGATLPSLLTAVAMVIGCFIFPIILSRYQKKQAKKREKLREDKYCAYLSSKVDEIQLAQQKEKEALFDNNPTLKRCYEIVTQDRDKLWNKVITDKDFLTVRVGTGALPTKVAIDAPREHFELYDDNLLKTLHEAVNNAKILYNVPITTSLAENNISSIVCDAEFKDGYVRGLLLQLLTQQSGQDLKIVVLTSEQNKHKWQFLKHAPHCWNDSKTIRYFATNLEEMKNISVELEKELNNRRDLVSDYNVEDDTVEDTLHSPDYIKFKSYYLIITDNYKDVKTLPFFNTLTALKKNYGFSSLIVSSSIQELPNACTNFIYVNVLDKNSYILHIDENGKTQTSFVPEYDLNINFDKVAETIANIPFMVESGAATLPTAISFLDMYHVGRVEQLNVLNRWQTNSPINTLSVPIGVYPNGDEFKLDLHEKAHGPHGLVAGSTGSGKSELLITYILSMAVNYHPDYVQFVLIDYKGGGLAGAFENRETGEKIPHLAGTITNLDSSSINRTLVSIESELKKRQAKFNEVRNQVGESTIDIYKYQKLYREGVVKDPIPHLFIISDEFAELKQQQPEFMTQLISAARIGRSLGVHLILATQKPSGVVNDQIWSNSRFKICLRVQTRQDSLEMLKREEAASIKETGRFYLQVGYNEIFEEGQSAWCGAPYTPTDKLVQKIDNSVEFIDDVGNSIKRASDIVRQDVEHNYGEQLTNIVKYLVDMAKRENVTSKSLWLEPLSDKLYLPELKNKYNYNPEPYKLEALIGEYDNPTSQMQGLATIDITNGGNIVIYGEVGSGKENLMYTIISSLIMTHTSNEVNFYLVDYASETMKMFQKLPHVGDVLYSDDTEKFSNLLTTVEEEIDKRKALFEDYMGSYSNYIRNSGNKIPQIIIMMAGYDVIIENYPRLFDRLVSLFRECTKYGVYFVISSTIANAIRARVAQLFANKVCMQMQDTSEYHNLLGAPRSVFPAKKFGRGLVSINDNVYEFQTSNLCPADVFPDTINQYAEESNKVSNYFAPKIKILPKYVLASSLLKDEEVNSLESVPIGINRSTLNAVRFNFTSTKVLPVISNFIDDEFGFISGLTEVLRVIPNVKVRVIDFLDLCAKRFDDVPVYKDNFDTVIQQVDIELEKDKTTTRTTVFIFVGVGVMKSKISSEFHPVIDKIFNKISSLEKNLFIVVDNYISYRGIESERWYSTAVNNMTGIWLGEGITNQMSLKTNVINVNERGLTFRDMAYLINKGKSTLFKHVTDKEKDNNE